MKDFSYQHVSGPHFYGNFSASMGAENRPKGRVCRVDYDSKAWFYKVQRGEVRSFKQWILDVFPPCNGEKYKVSGVFPFYDVEKAREK